MLAIYRSSAGSGKTFTLVRNYIDYLFSAKGNNKHRKLLAVTFTKKATAEMKDRIIKELSLLANNQGSAHAEFLRQKHSLSESQLQIKAQAILFDILQDYSMFAVTTIDSFFQQIVRSFAHELSLQGSYNIELDEKQIRHAAVDDFFFNLPKDSTSPVIQQLMSIIEDNMDEGESWNPTQVVYELTAQLFKETFLLHKDSIDQLLSKADSLNQYRKELRQWRKDFFERFFALVKQKEKIVPPEYEDEFSQKSKRFSVFRWTKADIMKFLKAPKELNYLRELFENTESMGKTDFARQQAIKLQPVAHDLYRLLFSDEAKKVLNADIILTYLPYLEIIHEVEICIRRSNKELNRLPISQTNLLLHRVIAEQSDTPFIYDKIGTRIQHYLIDEFQDTSDMQWSNFHPLVSETNAQGNENLVVGDSKQSIYRWRNSDYALLEYQLKKDFINQAKENILPNNYRSDRTIVEQNNKIFGLLTDAMQQEYDMRLDFKDSANGIKRVYNSYLQEPTRAESGYLRIEFLPFSTAAQRRLEAMNRLPDILHDLQQRGYNMSDVVFLIRNNSEGGKLANYLMSQGFEVMSNDSMLVDSAEEVKFIILLLKWQIHPKDQLIQTELQYHYDLIKGKDAHQALMHSINITDNTLWQEAIQYSHLPLLNQVEKLIRHFNLRVNEGSQLYLQAFEDVIYNYSNKYSNDLYSFLDWWDQTGSQTKISMPTNSQSVQVMTIHKSKGLEFDVVIVPFCDWETSDAQTQKKKNILWVEPKDDLFSMNGQIPLLPVVYSSNLKNTIFASDYKRELQDLYIDNLNLTYVAFTRAKHELYVFGPTSDYTTAKGNTANDRNNIGGMLHSLLKQELTENIYQSGNKRIKESEQPQTPHILVYDDRTGHQPQLLLHSNAQDFFLAERPKETNSSANLGIIMHQLLCQIKHKDDESTAISRLLQEGVINAEQMGIIKTEMRRFWQLIDGKDWFDEHYEILNEQSIVLPNGMTRRPDRVLLDKEKAIVIDYKFGYLQPQEHKEQVKEYMCLIKDMGFEVEGYLCYVNKKEIIPVNL